MSDKVDKKTEAALWEVLENAKAFTQMMRERKEKQLWRKVELPCNLHAALYGLTKDDLDQIRRNYQFKGLSALKKAELAVELARSIPLTFNTIIDTFDQSRYDLIKTIVKHSGVIAAGGLSVSKIEALRGYGILFPGIYGDKRILFMPNELVRLFEQSDDSVLQQFVCRNNEWIQLAHGLLHYFGVMDERLMVEKIETITRQSVDRFDFMRVMAFACDFYGRARLTDYGFRDCRVFDAEKIEEERRMRPDLDDYPFTRKQLMKAAAPDYVERSPQMNQLIQFLLSYYKISHWEINELVLQIIELIQTDAKTSKVIQWLQTRMEFPSFDFVQELNEKITDVHNHTRQWALKGHTPNELFHEEMRHLKPLPEQPFAPLRVDSSATTGPATLKIGRNDPCPCGSGKKYKKCCGK